MAVKIDDDDDDEGGGSGIGSLAEESNAQSQPDHRGLDRPGTGMAPIDSSGCNGWMAQLKRTKCSSFEPLSVYFKYC
jgi:hypothetical protein